MNGILEPLTLFDLNSCSFQCSQLESSFHFALHLFWSCIPFLLYLWLIFEYFVIHWWLYALFHGQIYLLKWNQLDSPKCRRSHSWARQYWWQSKNHWSSACFWQSIHTTWFFLPYEIRQSCFKTHENYIYSHSHLRRLFWSTQHQIFQWFLLLTYLWWDCFDLYSGTGWFF